MVAIYVASFHSPVNESSGAVRALEIGLAPVRREVSVQVLLRGAPLGTVHACKLLHTRVEAVEMILEAPSTEYTT